LAGTCGICVVLTGSPTETGPLGIPEEDDATLGQAAYNAHQVPLPGILLIEQRLQLALGFDGDFLYVLGVIASVPSVSPVPGSLAMRQASFRCAHHRSIELNTSERGGG
jgi:hypothetical protein